MLTKSRLKYIQSLGQKKFRDEAPVFIAEGPKIVEELLKEENAIVQELYATQEWLDEHPSLPAKPAAISITAQELERMSQLKTPNRVLAVVEKFPVIIPAPPGKISIVLDAIQDPGNLGTIIRIADWFGIRDVICNTGCAELYNPKLVQATMGSIARVNVFYTDLMTWLPAQDRLPIYATVLDGKNISELQPPTEGLLLVGNESKGIHDSLIEFATEKITIPKKGKAESLNAAVATGIVLGWMMR
jgi:TrmH family RNA methyltransferase